MQTRVTGGGHVTDPASRVTAHPRTGRAGLRAGTAPDGRQKGEAGDGPGTAIARLEAENRALRAERDEARQQQTAIADVLRVIASAPTALGVVLDTIAQAAQRLCQGWGAGVSLTDGERGWIASFVGGRGQEWGRQRPQLTAPASAALLLDAKGE